ncbi:hypothetical protein Cmtc_28470 [Cupriavidus sp. TKC]|uniref:N-6 DNA methylase n=1 Tax=unclassified Cupriavidus TaxID=2640874 RepID=UPI0025810EB7|nr:MULTISPECIES: N-6 DNA methylase [unclassified Cupriavidus]GMG91627.1 hypothetical protein Cmtc_28470 [Cupriavidus sp. TKC]
MKAKQEHKPQCDGKHKKKVLIVDASRLFRRGRPQDYLEPEHAADILGRYREFTDVQDAVRVVSHDEIKSEDWTLKISRYILPPLQEDIVQVKSMNTDEPYTDPVYFVGQRARSLRPTQQG